MERKKEIRTFMHTERFYIYIIGIQVVIRRKNKCVPTDAKCTNYFMTDQYVKGVQQRKRASLRLMDCKMITAILGFTVQ